MKHMQGTVNGVFSYRGIHGRPWVIVDDDTTENDLDQPKPAVFVEPTEPELWIGYVRRNTTGWPPRFTSDRRVIRVRDAGLAVRLANLLEADIKEKGW